MRKRGCVDENQPQIVSELRKLGYSVLVMSSLGGGAPDILVGGLRPGKTYQSIPGQSEMVPVDVRMNWAFEIKRSTGFPSDRRMTKDEMAWHRNWRGQIAVIETVEDALRVMTR